MSYGVESTEQDFHEGIHRFRLLMDGDKQREILFRQKAHGEK